MGQTQDSKKYSNTQLLLIAFLLAFVLFESLHLALTLSPLWDERCYVGAGLSPLETGSFRSNAYGYHPPLTFYLSSLFLLPLDISPSVFSSGNCWDAGNEIIYHSGYDPKVVLFLSRLPFALLSLLFAAGVLLFSRRLYGNWPSLLALTLYAFNTALLSHSGVAITDLIAQGFMLLSIFSCILLLEKYSHKRLALTSLFLGLALLSKHTSILLFGLFGIMWLLTFLSSNRNRIIASSKSKTPSRKKSTKQQWMGLLRDAWASLFPILCAIALSLLILFAGYGFSFSTLSEVMPTHYYDRAIEEIAALPSPNQEIARAVIDDIPFPAPSYFFGLAFNSYASSEGRERFFLGEIVPKSTPIYPITSLALKIQLSLLALLVISLFLFIKKRQLEEWFVLLPIILLLLLFTFNSFTSGISHLLAIFPFLCVFASRAATIPLRAILPKAFLALLILHYILTALLSTPYHYSYFNEIVGKENGHKYLGSANLDNGQYLPQLKHKLDELGIAKVNLSYLGSIDPKEYGISYDYMPSPYFQYWVPDYVQHDTPSSRTEDCKKRSGYVVVSASNRQGVYLYNRTCYSWLSTQQPIGNVAHSLFIYNISKQ